NYKGFKLAARVDRIDLKKDEIVLIDYKTSKSAEESENYPYELQTTFYFLWAKENFKGKNIKAIIWDIFNSKKIEGVIKSQTLDEVLEKLPKRVKEAEDIVYQLDGKEKIKTVGEICRYCEYKTACGRE
ncbi:MAG: PD-(D/E)XK nuclease family protein, partial [Nautiliaceae bacterium]